MKWRVQMFQLDAEGKTLTLDGWEPFSTVRDSAGRLYVVCRKPHDPPAKKPPARRRAAQ